MNTTDMNIDPTREEMQEFLAAQPCGENCADDIEIAIYWFACYWHGGQGSNLYSVLNTSPYSPGPIARLESEGDAVGMMYDALEVEYKMSTAHMRRLPGDDVTDTVTDTDPIRGGELT